MQDVDRVQAAFVDPTAFWSSPLYRHLCAVVADEPFLVGVAAHARAGQGPSFAFFGAVHALLLAGARHRLADYYPSVVGVGARAPDEDAGPALLDFVHAHEAELADLLAQRLVQTNHVQRALGLRLGPGSGRDACRPASGPPARGRQQRRVGAAPGLVRLLTRRSAFRRPRLAHPARRRMAR